MTEKEIIKRKIELKQQAIFLTLQEISELKLKIGDNELKNHSDISLFVRNENSPGDTRLNQIIGFISAIAPDIIDKLFGLLDYKGYLTVTWHTKPSNTEMDIMTFAWGCSPVGDGCGMMNVEHRIMVN